MVESLPYHVEVCVSNYTIVTSYIYDVGGGSFRAAVVFSDGTQVDVEACPTYEGVISACKQLTASRVERPEPGTRYATFVAQEGKWAIIVKSKDYRGASCYKDSGQRFATRQAAETAL